MTDEIQKQEFSKTSPLKKASYATVFTTVAAIALPFAFGINTFAWVASWFVNNWPQVIIIAGFAIWFGKSRLSG